MAPPIETPAKAQASQPPARPVLNERIVSSMTRRSVAAHPWHDLEIGMCCKSHSGIPAHSFILFNVNSPIDEILILCPQF